MDTLDNALARLKAFRRNRSVNVIEIESGLTTADLDTIIAAAERATRTVAIRSIDLTRLSELA